MVTRANIYYPASLRRDGSSRFGVNNQYGISPISFFKWIITEENFMKSLPSDQRSENKGIIWCKWE
jgi:hypothetical protein